MQKFLSPQSGQGLVEYAMILLLVAVVIIGVLTLMGPQIGNLYGRVVVCVPPTPLCN